MGEKKLWKNEALLWFGGLTSKFGNIIFDYANSISIVGAFTSKPWILALYQSSETIIQIIFNLIGGAKADKGNRKKIVIITDLLSALICGGLSFWVDSGYMAQVMVMANALLALVYAFNSPTYKSMVREVIERERIGFFNSVAHAGSEIIRVGGPIVGVGLVKVIGVRGALIFDACTFVLSALAEFHLTKVIDASDVKKGRQSVFADIAEGVQYLCKEKQILFLVILSSLVNFFLAGYNLLLPYTDVIFDGFGKNFYSRALAIEADGGIISSALCAKKINKYKNNISMLILFLAGTGAALILEPPVALLKNYYICLVPFALFGMMLTALNIQFMSYVQIVVDENYLGRVVSIIFTVAVLFMPVGSFVFSLFINPDNVNSFYLVGGGIAGVALIAKSGLFLNKFFMFF